MIVRKEWPLRAAISTALGALSLLLVLLMHVSTSDAGHALVDFPTTVEPPNWHADSDLLNDLQLQDVMRTLRRMKRSAPKSWFFSTYKFSATSDSPTLMDL